MLYKLKGVLSRNHHRHGLGHSSWPISSSNPFGQAAQAQHRSSPTSRSRAKAAAATAYRFCAAVSHAVQPPPLESPSPPLPLPAAVASRFTSPAPSHSRNRCTEISLLANSAPVDCPPPAVFGPINSTPILAIPHHAWSRSCLTTLVSSSFGCCSSSLSGNTSASTVPCRLRWTP
jgi:hypothetical protein